MSYLSTAYKRDMNNVTLEFVNFSYTDGKHNFFNVVLKNTAGERLRTRIARPATWGKKHPKQKDVIADVMFMANHAETLADGKPVEQLHNFLGWNTPGKVNQRKAVGRHMSTADVRKALAIA